MMRVIEALQSHGKLLIIAKLTWLSYFCILRLTSLFYFILRLASLSHLCYFEGGMSLSTLLNPNAYACDVTEPNGHEYGSAVNVTTLNPLLFFSVALQAILFVYNLP